MGKLILIFDCVTSGLTAHLYHVDGKLLSEFHCPLHLTLKQNYAQQNPEEWWNAVCKASHAVINMASPLKAKDIAVISFSAQSQVCLCLDANGIPLYPAITWSDTRSEEAPNPIRFFTPEEHYHLTGLFDEPSSSIRKLLWLKEYQPNVYRNTCCMVQCKDYLAYRLTGQLYTDYTDASSTHALDINTMSWCTPILETAGIPSSIFPPISYSNSVIGTVTPTAASASGLIPGTPVVLGAGDVLCNAVGAGCTIPGQVYLNLGSSSWIAQCREKPLWTSANIINNPHAVPGKFLCFSPMQENGVIFKWLKNEAFCYSDKGRCPVEPFRNIYPYTNMSALASKSCVGANGLFFLPYFLGTNAKILNGAIINLSWKHTQEDIVRAALEGICFEYKKLWEIFTNDLPASHLVVTGLGASEGFWLQLLADILNIPVFNTNLSTTPDGIGAAILAGHGINLYPDFSQTYRFYRIKEKFYPKSKQVASYERLFSTYKSITDAYAQITI